MVSSAPSRGELDRRFGVAAGMHGVVADPFLRLLRKDQALSRPGDPLDALERLAAGLAVPDFTGSVALDTRHHERQRVSAAERGAVQPVERDPRLHAAPPPLPPRPLGHRDHSPRDRRDSKAPVADLGLKPERQPGRLTNARRLPSGDHVGLPSTSTLGDT